jgi:hypothetical protein
VPKPKRPSGKKKTIPKRRRRPTPGKKSDDGVGLTNSSSALGMPKDIAAQLSLQSLDDVADALKVSLNKIKRWRKSPHQKELQSGRPYNLGRVVLELLIDGHLSRSRLDHLPEPAKHGLAAHFATQSYSDALVGKIKKALPDILEKLEQDSKAFGITEEDWDELEQIAKRLGFTEEWFNQLGDDEETEREAYLQCIAEMNPETQARFRAYFCNERNGEVNKQTQIHRSPKKPAFESHERIGIAVGFPKTAALFLDKVWSLDDEMPPEFQLRLGTPTEAIYQQIIKTMVRETADACNANSLIPIALEKARELDMQMAPQIESMICGEFKKITGHTLPAFLGTRAAFGKVYEPGDCEVLSAAIVSIPIVDESKLEWEQIQEIRADEASMIKLRRFFGWVDDDMAGKTAVGIKDAISTRLEDYDRAVKKHGVQTLTGSVITTIKDPRLFLTATGVGAASSGGSLEMGTTVALGILGANVVIEAIKIGHRYLEDRTTNDIAYVHEIHERFAS